MAIIDILTPYDAKKKAAHAAKTVKHGVSELSASFRAQPSAAHLYPVLWECTHALLPRRVGEQRPYPPPFLVLPAFPPLPSPAR